MKQFTETQDQFLLEQTTVVISVHKKMLPSANSEMLFLIICYNQIPLKQKKLETIVDSLWKL